MDRRRYLALGGALLVAGCQADGEGASPTATATGTQPSDTPASSPTDEAPGQTDTDSAPDTDTATPTDDERVETAIAEAEAAILDSHAAYLGFAEGAETFLDVGPETTGFDPTAVTGHLAGVVDSLDAVTDLADDEQSQLVDHHREAATWLDGAATVQGEASDVAEALEAAATTDADADYETVAGHLSTAQSESLGVAEALRDVRRPSTRLFGRIDGIRVDDVDEKHSRFVRWRVGMSNLSGLIDETTQAVDLIRGAQQRFDDEDYDRAESRADGARRDLQGLHRRVEDGSIDALGGLDEWVLAALDALSADAEALRDRAADPPT